MYMKVYVCVFMYTCVHIFALDVDVCVLGYRLIEPTRPAQICVSKIPLIWQCVDVCVCVYMCIQTCICICVYTRETS